MHASLEQLIGLRDEEPVSVEVQQHVRGCGQCAAALNGLLAACERLTALADPLPPPDAWQRIAVASDRSRYRRRWLPAAGLGLAATAAAAALLVVNLHVKPVPARNDTAVVTPSGGQPADVNQLMAQSRYLERAVLKLDGPADSMAVSADTASTVAALEDRIAVVDYEINSAAGVDNDDPHMVQLWKQRVNLLQSLAAVRYAQVADAGI
ncbi:MAG TPA: hypothetical protein VH327_07620 [Gammaproteobacteria bacterium]|jgi:hypothetical protein|nr:hypothetical protein [Gammaproteobacteria bacterium]